MPHLIETSVYKERMKLGLFWLGKLTPEVDLAIQFLTKKSTSNHLEQLVMFTEQPRAGTTQFVRETTQYPYDTINDLQDVFRHARDANVDFALISFGNGFIVSPARLATLLASEPLRKSTWSFRICNITGAGFRHWPRRPHVDDHFILLNVGRAAETGFFNRKLIYASHFSHAGSRHAHLSSMIEYALKDGEFFNHFALDASRDQYGRICRFDPMPFHSCESTGFLSCYADFKPALYKLLRLNLDGPPIEPIVLMNGLRYFRRGEFWYLRPFLNLGNVVNNIKRPLLLGRFEFQRRYEEDI